MNIIGIGVDICKNSRIQNLINKFGNIFLERIFHQLEIKFGFEKHKDNILHLSNFFAKRFAGKEALIKAIGSSEQIKKNEIAILSNRFGRPEIIIFDKTKQYVEGKFSADIVFHISLSDEKEFSIANVVLEL